ncbi:hypothetical protein Goshw_023296 [Gossypium schwendimanii]|uniref:Uncharacterized protein n=1 Tax=Gossypium schwendimanii TaxID=34291 RepID=A0A7J9LXP2_GOSSC|nr:hypothetical protein [Gossypium schwendimanii]
MKNYACCIDWLEDMLCVLDKKVAADFFTILWNNWNNHNNCIFRGKEDEARVVWERAETLNNETSYGMIARDKDGFVIGGGGGFKEEVLTVEWAEIYAPEESLKLAKTEYFKSFN